MAINSRVPEYIAIDLFADLRIFERLRKGCLEEYTVSHQTRPAKMCRGISYYTRIEDQSGDFAARVHYVYCEDTGETHVYPSSIRVGDVNIFREGHQSPPPGPSR